MTKTTIATLAASMTLSLSLSAGSAHAIPDHPFGARKFNAEFVKAYRGCTAPNDVTNNPFAPKFACEPPVMEVPACEFGPSGKGKVKMRANVGAGDIGYKVKFKGLEPSCAGQQLDYAVRYRQTNNDCSIGSGECTAEDTDVIAGSCIVTASGNCSITGTINADAAIGPVFAPGLETSLELHGCGMLINGFPAFTCGMYLD